jgi:MoaA/NifB/PqqE/SkfB family radical SAM enzyme
MENVYSQVKMFHFHEKLKALKEKRVTPPVHIRLKPINACNHRCFYCCYRSDSLYLGELLNEKDMIPLEKMREITQDMAETGIKAVTFTGGGEPLIYPYIVEAVERLLNSGIKVSVLTNGSALKGNIAEVLAKGSSWVRISIDAADGKTLSKSRGVKPSEFENIINNIEGFAKQKNDDCELGINLIITKLNSNSVLKLIKLMKEKGADHVKISECVVHTSGTVNNKYHSDHFDEVAEQINAAESELSDESFKVINKFHDFDDKYDKKYTWCPFIHYLNVIGADLMVYTCQDKAYTDTGIIGSIKDKSLREFWESGEYRQRIMSIDPSRVCNHHCVSHGKNMSLINYFTTDSRHLEFV